MKLLDRFNGQKRKNLQAYNLLVAKLAANPEHDDPNAIEICAAAGKSIPGAIAEALRLGERSGKIQLAAQLADFQREAAKFDAEMQAVRDKREAANREAAQELEQLAARQQVYKTRMETAMIARNWLLQNVPDEIAQSERELATMRKPLAERLRQIQDYLNDSSAGGGRYARAQHEKRIAEAKHSGSPKRTEQVAKAEAELALFIANRITPLEVEAANLREQLAALDVEQEKLHRAKLEA